MSTCVDCRWFCAPSGRDGLSCRDVGEEPGSEVCDQYEKPKVDAQDYIGSLTQQSYREIFHEVLAEAFVLEQDMRLAVDTVKAQLQTQGANIDVEPLSFVRSAERLIDLYVTYRLGCAIGMNRYIDQIMDREIFNKFQPAMKSAQQVVRRG